MKTINLVATRERLARDFREHASVPSESSLGIASGDYQVNLDAIKTKLGRWLAEQLDTTRREDDASQITVLLPHTEEGLAYREMGTWLASQTRIRNAEDADSVLARLEAWIAQRRQIQKAYEPFAERVFAFQLPVYGSRAAEGADTPEEYFDVVARLIRQTGGVVVSAGLHRETLPFSIAATMADGTGEPLLMRHLQSKMKGVEKGILQAVETIISGN